MKPDFSPAQMQEMAETLLSAYGGNINRGVYAAALRQAASQAAEIERLSDIVEGVNLAREMEKRAASLAKEAAESRLLALREQVEGLPRYDDEYERGEWLKRADVLALFDPAQEKG